MAAMERTFQSTFEYARQRSVFGQLVAGFQANLFTLVELATEIQIARVFLDRRVSELVSGRLTDVDAAMAKWWTTELQNKVADRCLQLHGGYGYMDEYPVSKAWRDSRVQSIYGGTNEIMKEIVGRGLGL